MVVQKDKIIEAWEFVRKLVGKEFTIFSNCTVYDIFYAKTGTESVVK